MRDDGRGKRVDGRGMMDGGRGKRDDGRGKIEVGRMRRCEDGKSEKRKEMVEKSKVRE